MISFKWVFCNNNGYIAQLYWKNTKESFEGENFQERKLGQICNFILIAHNTFLAYATDFTQ